MKTWFCLLAFVVSSLLPAQAHRLTVEWEFVRGTLEIRGFLGDDPAAGADVELLDASGAVVAEGVLDDAGRFRWHLSGVGPITVELNAGLGHRRTLTLTEEDLRPGLTDREGPGSPADPADSPAPRAAGTSDTAFSQGVRVGLGLTFLLALAAAWMSHRNTRRLSQLERRLERYEGRG